jgi:hypothetical protein
MKTKLALLLCLLSATALAGPARPVNSSTFSVQTPCGPTWDSFAQQGQWFLDPASGSTNVNSWEYCDDDNALTIAGVVQSIMFNASSNITAFDVLVTVSNSLPGDFLISGNASNSHNEVQLPQAPSGGPATMKQTRITAEFAIADISMPPPANSAPPYWPDPVTGGQYHIVAGNENLWAWYCWDPNSGQQPAGNFQVPAWNLVPADIPAGGTAQVTMQFTVTGSGMPSSDYRHSVIRASKQLGLDVLYNRSRSLKISHWLDTLLIDYVSFMSTPPPPFWLEEPIEYIYASDASVFYNPEEEPDYPHKMHYPQLPDPNGWDVFACYIPPTDPNPEGIRKVLADDFLCTASGPITNITFWGSWFNDEFPEQDPFQGINNIHLSIHKDIPDPDGEGPEYSKPDLPTLWEWDINPINLPNGWNVRITAEEPSVQGWYNPNTGEFFPDNHMQYFRYDITVPQDEAFVQTSNTIYWLDVSVETTLGLWGWKTTTNHWNDDAVWADMPVVDTNQWKELYEPPLFEQSLDLAFIIDGPADEPEPYDFGDAPDTGQGTGPGNYETKLLDNGAYHMILPQGPYFDDGSKSDQPDGEPDGQPNANAKGDDNDYLSLPNDDEDGIFIPVLTVGQAATVTITVDDGGSGTGGAYVDAWIDYNADGDWIDANEQIVSGWLTQGPNPVVVNVPAGANIGQTFARFRINSSSAGLLPTGGPAQDGEVEDYEVTIELEKDWGDAPDPNYPTYSASGGAAHSIAGGANALRLGSLIDGDADGQPTNLADGDDVLDGNDDEDGIVFTSPIVPGIWATVDVTAFAGGASGFAYLQGWMDFNADGDWVDTGEQIFTDQFISFGATPTTTSLSYWVPLNATNAPTFARFRLCTATGVGIGGLAANGEVEDYPVEIEDRDVDWGDLPEPGYPVTAANNGAHHIITPFLFLGGFCDGETNGQPTINADGDDLNGLPDEDGVILKSVIMPGGYASVDVIAAQPGVLDAWLDFNVDGSFAQPSDQIFTGLALPQGTNALIFPVPLTASGGAPAHARFRFTSGSGAYPGGTAIPTGLAFDGEVEDYHWLISSIEDGVDWSDAPDPTYPTLSASGGAAHKILAGVMFGAGVDAETNGQPNATATGDDADIIYGPPVFDDEDGVSFSSKLVAGTNATVDVIAGVSGGKLDAWIDFNADGDWNDSGEQIFASISVAGGLNSLSFPVPGLPAQNLGPTYARFRISSGGGLSPSGLATEGEVEDYAVDLYQPAPTNLVITNLTFLAGYTNAVVEWTVETNLLYQMQASTNLMTNVWVDVGATVLGPNNAQTNNMAAETSKFYRVTAPWAD